MSRFNKLSHTIWHCQYHIVWIPKYRYKVLTGAIGKEADYCIRAFTEQQHSEVVELNVQVDHVHLMVNIPPKISVSAFMGTVKGRSAIRILSRFRKLRTKPYWGNQFWAKGYCVDTIGLNEETIRKYVKYQEKKEYRIEQGRFKF
jgi:putative transposase